PEPIPSFQPYLRRRERQLSDEDRSAFDEFFGVGALTEDPHQELPRQRGAIVLPTDLIESLADGWTRSDPMVGHNRPYKARRWINACDADGAQAVMQMFAGYGATIPKLVFNYETHPEDTSSAPFEITMGGLEKTRAEVKDLGKGWIEFKEMKD